MEDLSSIEMNIQYNPGYIYSEAMSNFEENSQYFASTSDPNAISVDLKMNVNPQFVSEQNSNNSEGNTENLGSTVYEENNYADCHENNKKDTEIETNNRKNKMKLNKKVEYIFNTIGYVVGLGNIWRFSNLCRKYGGTFIIIYALMYIVIGIPLFMLETYIGQFTSRGCIDCWGNCRILKAVGVGTVVLSISIMFTYMMFIVWSLKYFVLSFSDPLPWSNQSISKLYNITDPLSANVYFERDGFHTNESNGIEHLGIPHWPFVLGGFFAWLSIYACLFKGLKLSGKAVYITVIFPYLGGLILLIHSLTLTGSKSGLSIYVSTANISDNVRNRDLWSECAIQLLFSLSLSQGGLACLSSYNDLRTNILASSVFVPLIDFLTSIFFGLIVFSYIGYAKYKLMIPIEEIQWNGIHILFVIIPQAISETPVPQLWSIIFFLMLITLAFDVMLTFTRTVCIGIFEAFSNVKYLKDIYINSAFCTFSFITVIALSTPGGVYLFQLIKQYGDSWTMLLIAFLTCTLMNILYGPIEICNDISYMLKERKITLRIWRYVKYYFLACWCCITPIFLFFTLICNWIKLDTSFTILGHTYPPWSIMFGWLIGLCTPVSIIVVWIVYLIIAPGSIEKRIKYLTNSQPDEHLWSIATPTDMEELKEMKKKLKEKLKNKN